MIELRNQLTLDELFTDSYLGDYTKIEAPVPNNRELTQELTIVHINTRFQDTNMAGESVAFKYAILGLNCSYLTADMYRDGCELAINEIAAILPSELYNRIDSIERHEFMTSSMHNSKICIPRETELMSYLSDWGEMVVQINDNRTLRGETAVYNGNEIIYYDSVSTGMQIIPFFGIKRYVDDVTVFSLNKWSALHSSNTLTIDHRNIIFDGQNRRVRIDFVLYTAPYSHPRDIVILDTPYYSITAKRQLRQEDVYHLVYTDKTAINSSCEYKIAEVDVFKNYALINDVFMDASTVISQSFKLYVTDEEKRLYDDISYVAMPGYKVDNHYRKNNDAYVGKSVTRLVTQVLMPWSVVDDDEVYKSFDIYVGPGHDLTKIPHLDNKTRVLEFTIPKMDIGQRIDLYTYYTKSTVDDKIHGMKYFVTRDDGYLYLTDEISGYRITLDAEPDTSSDQAYKIVMHPTGKNQVFGHYPNGFYYYLDSMPDTYSDSTIYTKYSQGYITDLSEAVHYGLLFFTDGTFGMDIMDATDTIQISFGEVNNRFHGRLLTLSDILNADRDGSEETIVYKNTPFMVFGDVLHLGYTDPQANVSTSSDYMLIDTYMANGLKNAKFIRTIANCSYGKKTKSQILEILERTSEYASTENNYAIRFRLPTVAEVEEMYITDRIISCSDFLGKVAPVRYPLADANKCVNEKGEIVDCLDTEEFYYVDVFTV